VNLTSWEKLFSIVVLLGWIAIFFVPVEVQVKVGVQAAFMLVLGRVLGISIARRNGD
jgi:hypothetical protein